MTSFARADDFQSRGKFSVARAIPRVRSCAFVRVAPEPAIYTLCLNETKIDNTVSDGDIQIPGYISYRQDRTLYGRGTMIYAAEYLNTKKSCRLSKKDQEAVWIEVKLKS